MKIIKQTGKIMIVVLIIAVLTIPISAFAATLKRGNDFWYSTGNVSGETFAVDGNTAYCVNPLQPIPGKALAGAKFGLYKTEADASNKEHAIAVGTSDTNGKVVFLNGSNEEMKVQSGNYFIAELEAPEGYNVYGKVIPISVEVSYLDAFANNTWVENAPKDGFATATVTDTKLIVPQTGGYVQYVYLAGVISLLIGGTMFLVSRRIKNR